MGFRRSWGRAVPPPPPPHERTRILSTQQLLIKPDADSLRPGPFSCSHARPASTIARVRIVNLLEDCNQGRKLHTIIFGSKIKSQESGVRNLVHMSRVSRGCPRSSSGLAGLFVDSPRTVIQGRMTGIASEIHPRHELTALTDPPKRSLSGGTVAERGTLESNWPRDVLPSQPCVTAALSTSPAPRLDFPKWRARWQGNLSHRTSRFGRGWPFDMFPAPFGAFPKHALWLMLSFEGR